jgi:hypothetical protein
MLRILEDLDDVDADADADIVRYFLVDVDDDIFPANKH